MNKNKFRVTIPNIINLKILKKILPYSFKRRIKENLGVPSLHWSLENLKKNGFNPDAIIDIGAYEGKWAIAAMEVFPSSQILMIEAQKAKDPKLKIIADKFPNSHYLIALLSKQEGYNKLFLNCETGSHIIDSANQGDLISELPTRTLDNCLTEKNFTFSNLLLKLDVQGHEMEVLKGGKNAMLSCEVCLLEISFLNLGDNGPLLAQMVSFMDNNYFQPYDISEMMRRPYDKALYQLDMIFVKKDSKLIESRRWN